MNTWLFQFRKNSFTYIFVNFKLRNNSRKYKRKKKSSSIVIIMRKSTTSLTHNYTQHIIMYRTRLAFIESVLVLLINSLFKFIANRGTYVLQI